MKGIIHFHSRYSFDSIITVGKIANLALKNKIDFLILTDHNTIDGSLALRKYVQNLGHQLIVPISAEYKTEYGDIIAAFIQTEINETSFSKFIRSVRDQNGLLFLPHPFSDHSHHELIAQHVDFIEIFNSRQDAEHDLKAMNLAKRYGKKTYCGPDFHTLKSFSNAIVEIDTPLSAQQSSSEKRESYLKELLQSSTIECPTMRRSSQLEILLSIYIKAFKTKNPLLIYPATRNFIIQTMQNLFK